MRDVDTLPSFTSNPFSPVTHLTAIYTHYQVVRCIFRSPFSFFFLFFLALPSFHPLMAAVLLPSLHSQSGLSRMREWGSLKQSVKHLRRWKEGLKRYLISGHCVTTAYTHTHTHTHTHTRTGTKPTAKKHICAHTHTHRLQMYYTLCFWH